MWKSTLVFCTLLLATVNGQTCQPDQQRSDCGHLGTTQAQCESSGCCWSPKDNQPWCFYKSGGPVNKLCMPDVSRVDCGREGTTQEQCEGTGCCWQLKPGAAYCFFPSPTYLVEDMMTTATGVKATLKLSGSNFTASAGSGCPIESLMLEMWQETTERLHFKITDPNNQRWEVPENFLPVPTPPSSPPTDPLYSFEVAPVGSKFSLTVTRKSNKEILFSTSSDGLFYFSDQYLSIGTSLPQNYNLYGLGEHKAKLRLEKTTYTLWTYDTPTPKGVNLYGSHPFYLDLRTDGSAHGVFLKNSNGMDIELEDTSLNYRVIGGVLDFYIFLGPNPEAVIQQYQEVIGRPHMPPYWALGFHQCRYGYNNLQEVIDVVNKFEENKIPLDTAWVDIDYMDTYKDFTVGSNFALDKMQAFVAELHQNGQHFVVIIDPGISNSPNYEPYSYGLSQDIFIKDSNNKVFIGKVWPGNTAYPDFLNLNTHKYWQHEIEGFLKLVPVDGLWIDMNEASNFCNGACDSQSTAGNASAKKTIGFDPTNPPYQINNQNSKQLLNTKTLDMNAMHHGGIPEYNAHNLYGFTESIATCSALENLRPGIRSFVLSRSTFPGSGVHTAHWTGDNFATFDDMYWSIPGILNFQMFGVPLVGSDICGFIGATSEELCGRWMALGSFYPFSRNHNTKGAPSQEPFVWDSVAAISRKYLGIRYSLLPYYYTLYYKAHRSVDQSNPPSATVVRPLFFEFPQDSNTYPIDWQFMVGRSLLLSPQLQQGGKSVNAYFPTGQWFEWGTFKLFSVIGKETKTINTPIDYLPIHIRGGSVIPLQNGTSLNTTMARMHNFSLLVFLDSGKEAAGDIFLDDGVSLDMKEFTYIEYTVTNNTLSNKVSGTGYASKAHLPLLNEVIITAVSKPTQVTVNGKKVGFSYSSYSQSLLVFNLNIVMDGKLNLTWV